MRNPNITYKARRSLRLPGYDYRQDGVYFVTMCAFKQARLFGAIDDGEMRLNELGKIVEEEWLHITDVRSNVKQDLFIVMPNHIHGLVTIESLEHGDTCRNAVAPAVTQSDTLQAGSLGAIIGQFKLAVVRRAKKSGYIIGQSIWQRNYHEHIVRNEESLNDIRRYIVENPVRWAEDSLYVE